MVNWYITLQHEVISQTNLITRSGSRGRTAIFWANNNRKYTLIRYIIFYYKLRGNSSPTFLSMTHDIVAVVCRRVVS